jgi:MFS family permease
MERRLGDLRGPGLAVVLGGLVCQMGLGYGYVFGPLAPDLLADFGWTRATLSAARAPQIFVIALASPLVGFVTVRFGARGVLVAATLLLGASFVLLSGISTLWQLSALYMLQGLAVSGLGDISVGHVVSQWVVRNRGLALGLVYTGSNLGGALLTRVAAGVADAVSWRTAFLGIPCAALLVREPPASARSAATKPAAGGEPESPDDLTLRQALRTRSFWILGASIVTFFFYFLGMLEHLVLFLTDAGMPRAEAAGHFSNAILLGMFSKVAFGWLSDRIPHRSAILLDYGLLAASSLVLLLLPHPVWLPLFVLCYGVATAARDVVTPLAVVDCFGVRYLAPIYGALMLGLLPGGVLGPIFAAAVHDRFGSYDVAFGTFALLNLVTVAALFALRDERTRDAGASGRHGRSG